MNQEILKKITNQDYNSISTRIQEGLKQTVTEIKKPNIKKKHNNFKENKFSDILNETPVLLLPTIFLVCVKPVVWATMVIYKPAKKSLILYGLVLLTDVTVNITLELPPPDDDGDVLVHVNSSFTAYPYPLSVSVGFNVEV